jgi:CelD/BcsL family acetyltransferase involved in cellulose biosynthesis
VTEQGQDDADRPRARPDDRWTIEVLRTVEEVDRIEDDWDTLARTCGGAPFTLPAVAMAWWRHCGQGRLRVVTVRDADGALRAIAPLHDRRLGPGTAIRWLGTGLGSVCEVVAAPGDEAAAVAVWTTVRPHRDVLDLHSCRADGTGLRDLAAATGLRVRSTPTEPCPVVDLSTIEGPSAHIEGRRYLRKKLNRYDRIVEAAGLPFGIEVVVDADRLTAVVPELDAVHDAAEAARPRQHLLAAPWRAFTLDAMVRTARRGQLAVFLARQGDRPVAFDICFRVGSRLGNWLGRFDPVAAEISPGHLLLRRELEWSAEQGITTLDLLVGEDEYKMRWATGTYGTAHLVGGTPLALAVGHRALEVRDRLHGLARRRRIVA